MKNFKRRFLWLLVLLVLGAMVWGVVEHLRRKWRLEAYKAELVKQGVELDLAKLIPPVPPDEENAAVILQQTIYAFRPAPLKDINVAMPMKMMEPGRARVEWQQPQPDGRDMPVTWEQLAQAVAANEPLLAQLRKAARRPHLDFKLDYPKGVDLLWPHVAEIRPVINWLTASVLLKLRAGDTSGAIAEVECAVLLAHLLREEPLLISQLVVIAMDSITLGVTWELLQADGLLEADLARLQAAWAKREQGAGLLKAVEFEVTWTSKMIQDARASAKYRKTLFTTYQLGSFGGTPTPATPQSFGEWVDHIIDLTKYSAQSAAEEIKMLHWKFFGSYNDEWINLLQSKVQIDLLQAIHSGTLANDLLPAYGKRHKEINALARAQGSAFVADDFQLGSKLPERAIQNESYRCMVETAIALKRYQLKHGEWPETLEALVPEFLAAVPVDPADGQPLRYKRKEKGEFLLYTLGVNHRDDGGDPNREKQNETPNFHLGKDWVWPMPVQKIGQEQATAP